MGSRRRSNTSALNFTDSNINVPSDEDVFGEYGSTDLENQPIEVDELSGISTREKAMLRLEKARESGADEEEIARLEKQLEEAIAEIKDYEQRAIIPLENGRFGFRQFEFSAIGMQVPKDITETDIDDFLLALKEADDAIAWTVGDLANAAEEQWGKTYDQLEKATGYKYQTLADYAYVARQIDFSIRIEKLKFSHHRIVAAMDSDEQRLWLEKCATCEWSVSEFRRQITASKQNGKTTVTDILHRDKQPKFSKVEKIVQRAIASGKPKDVQKAREQLYQSRKATDEYFDALEDELNSL